MTKVARIFGILFPRLRVCDNFDKNWIVQHFGRLLSSILGDFSQSHLVALFGIQFAPFSNGVGVCLAAAIAIIHSHETSKLFFENPKFAVLHF
jgi:hypothetical protein